MFRNKLPPEPIDFHAHRGTCRTCGGIVKMVRGEDLQLQLDQCWCLYCGQRYFVELPAGMTREQFDRLQWQEKAEVSDGTHQDHQRGTNGG